MYFAGDSFLEESYMIPFALLGRGEVNVKQMWTDLQTGQVCICEVKVNQSYTNIQTLLGLYIVSHC